MLSFLRGQIFDLIFLFYAFFSSLKIVNYYHLRALIILCQIIYLNKEKERKICQEEFLILVQDLLHYHWRY